MKFRERLTRKNILIASGILAVVFIVAGYYWLRRPPPVQMARYVPASALAFIEIYNLSDLVEGITDTRAWGELAPALGLSSQLRQIGLATDLLSRTGLGPGEAVVAGRAQLAVALTGLDAETGAGDDGPYVHFRPQIAFIVETHSSIETTARLARERAPILAQRIYGESVIEQTEDYFGTPLLVFRGPQAERQLIAATMGSVLLIANHPAAIRSSLDAIAGRAASLSENPTLRERQPEITDTAAVFAFLTEAGLERLFEIGPAIIASRLTTDPERVGTIADLFGHLSKQAAAGVLFSLRFDSGGVAEKYLTVLRPRVAEGLVEPMKPAPGGNIESLSVIPRDVADVTILRVERAGELPERVLKQLAPRLDVVAAVALREFVLGLRKQLGVEPGETVGDAVGNEMALIRFNESEPVAMLFRVGDRQQLTARVYQYLSQDRASVSATEYNGSEVTLSSNQDGRAAVFVGDFLALGTRDQLARIIDAQTSKEVAANNERLKKALAGRPPGSSVISYGADKTDAAEMMLSLSKLARVSDGSRDLLEQDSVRGALDRLPPRVGFTEFRDYGIYTEVRSAVGSFSLIGSMLGGPEQQ